MEDLTGKQLGQYRIVTPLGEGGMASVYKAYQANMDRYVAIKILPRHYASDPNFIHRFSREAKVIAGLEHPNILPVYDFGAEEGYTYLVMRLVETGTLNGLLQGKPMDLAEVEGLISQIADALDYAHAHGVIHRDVKPSNVLIDPLGRCLLTDFGLAKVLLSVSMFTSSGTFLGTPKYASPEQCLGKELDQRSDIYSLGVILYEMVTGRPPFDAETPMGIVVKHIHDPLPMPRQINPALPEAVERVILKALAKEPEERYATAGELAKALRGAILESDSLVRQELQARTLPGKKLEKKRVFPVWGWVAGGVLAFGLVAGLIVLAVRSVARLVDLPVTSPAQGNSTVLDRTETILPTSFQAESTIEPSLTLPIKQTEAVATQTQMPTEIPLAAIPSSTTITEEKIPPNLTYQDWQNPISFPAPASGMADVIRVDDEVWVLAGSSMAQTLFHLNLQGEILSETPFEVTCRKAAWDGEALWCASGRNYVSKVDPQSGKEVSQMAVDIEAHSVAWDGTRVWIISTSGDLEAYDSAGKRVKRLAVATTFSGHVLDMEWVQGELFVAFWPPPIYRYDQGFTKLGELSACFPPKTGLDLMMSWDGNSLWFADSDSNRIYQCVPRN